MSFPRKRESRVFVKSYYVYIMASKKNGTLYIGVTNDLLKRVREHKDEITDGFASKYNVNKLVFFKQTPNIEAAIQ
jgi:putative endonuclease